MVFTVGQGYYMSYILGNKNYLFLWIFKFYNTNNFSFLKR